MNGQHMGSHVKQDSARPGLDRAYAQVGLGAEEQWSETPAASHSAILQAGRLARPRQLLLRIGGMLRRRVVTIDMDDERIRVVVLEGGRVKRWGRADLVELGYRQDDGNVPTIAEMSEELGALLNELYPCSGRVVTSLPLQNTLARSFTLPRIGRRLLGQVILAEVMEMVPFSVDEVDVAARSNRTGTGYQVVAIATPKGSIDKQVQIIKQVGKRPSATYSKAAALALAVGVEDLVVVDLTSDEATVVLVREGDPRVAHRTEVADPSVDLAGAADALVKVIDRVASTDHTQGAGDAGQPVSAIFVDHTARERPLADELKKRTDLEVLTLTPSSRYPDLFPAQEYGVNMGLARLDGARPRIWKRVLKPTSPPLGLLPQRHRLRPFPLVQFLMLAIFSTLGYTSFLAADGVDATRSTENTLSSQILDLENRVRSRNLVLAIQGVADTRRSDDSKTSGLLESKLISLDSKAEILLARLTAISEQFGPSQVNPSTILLSEDRVFITGTAASYQQLVQYSKDLRESDIFPDARILQADKTSGSGFGSSSANLGAGAISFQLQAFFPSVEASTTDAISN